MKYDVIVCGAGPSGINAAISASRNNMKVLLIESTSLIGGNPINALVEPWMTFHKGNKQVVRGIASEIVERLVQSGNSLGYIKDPLNFCETITPINVEGAKALFFDYIKEEHIDLLLHAIIFDVILENNQVKAVKVMTKGGELTFEAKVFIDTTGDGDVSKLAGADYIFGREKDNLAQPMTMIFQVANVDIERLKEEIRNNKEDFIIRDDYDYKYLGISGFFKKIERAKENNEFDLPRDRVLLFEEVIPNCVSVNMTRVQKLRGTNPFELTEAEIEGRIQIKKAFKFLKKYIPGFEHSYMFATPVKIGIRETRHIIGDYVLSMDDIALRTKFEDSIALSGFPIDIHSPDGSALEIPNIDLNEPISIPMRSLIVKGIENLLVAGRCVSATHEACASIRVTPTAMALGEAAGVLAALSVKNEVHIRKVSYKDVQGVLKKQGQVY